MKVIEYEYETLRCRFMFGLQHHQAKTGKKPDVCIMNATDYETMRFLCREECTIRDMNLQISDDVDIRYWGVEIHKSPAKGLIEMVFGGRE